MINPVLTNSRAAFFFFGVISAVALAAVYVAEYRFGLAPCQLCVFQRIPHMIVVGLCVLGLALDGKWTKSAPVFLGLTALSFAANTVIAVYHSGVERKWWPSFLEGCTIPQIEGSITDVLAQIQAAPLVRCDEIPWTDPVIGLSMANYNAAICFALALAAAACCIRFRFFRTVP